MYQLLKDEVQDDVLLPKWLQRAQKEYVSPQIQNEILPTVVGGTADTSRRVPVLQHAIISDGTQDISGQEQENICRFIGCTVSLKQQAKA